MTEGLTRRTVSGLAWMAVGTGGQIVLQVVVLAILARLIAPAEFGLVAAALIAVNLSALFAESGIGHALVQRKNLQDSHIRVAFTLSVALAVAIWAVLALTAPAIASLLRIEELPAVLRVIALVFVLRSLSLGQFLLLRGLRFRAMALVELASYALGYGGLAIPLALAGYGAWAIVAGQLGQAALRTLALWVVAPHPLRPSLAREQLRDVVGYGTGHTLFRIFNAMATEGDNFVVSRWLGATTLGLYGRAYQLMTMPATLFGKVTNDVLFPVMAAVQDQRAKLRRVYARGVAFVALLALPTSAVAAVLSEEIILVLLGRDWLALKPAFDVMVFGILFLTSYKLSDCLARAVGAVYRGAWRQAVYAVAVIGGTYLGHPWGLRGVAVGVLVALTVHFLLMAQLSLRLVEMRWRQFGTAFTPAAFVAGAMAVAAIAVSWPLRAADAPALVTLAASSAAAVLSALLLGRLAPRVPATRELAELLVDLRTLAGGRAGSLLTRTLGPAYGPSGPLPPPDAAVRTDMES